MLHLEYVDEWILCRSCLSELIPVPVISGNFEKLKVPLSPGTEYSAAYRMDGASMDSLYLWEV